MWNEISHSSFLRCLLEHNKSQTFGILEAISMWNEILYLSLQGLGILEMVLDVGLKVFARVVISDDQLMNV